MGATNGEQQRVAIGGRLTHVGRADVAAGARPVLDDELPPELSGQLLGDDAGDGIVGSAWRLWNHHGHRLGRIRFLRNRCRCHTERKEGLQELSDCHFFVSFHGNGHRLYRHTAHPNAFFDGD
ncbi:hypothetical protein D9M72_237390 [compost metagenome]